MRSALSLIAMAVTTATVSALQAINLGTKAGPNCVGVTPIWFAQFNDAPICDGTSIGPRGYGFYDICSYDSITILEHTNITFTGCDPDQHGNAIPTGVSDMGVPALTCVQGELEESYCPFEPPCGEADESTVQFTIFCS